jgi:hypothetical protein
MIQWMNERHYVKSPEWGGGGGDKKSGGGTQKEYWRVGRVRRLTSCCKHGDCMAPRFGVKPVKLGQELGDAMEEVHASRANSRHASESPVELHTFPCTAQSSFNDMLPPHSLRLLLTLGRLYSNSDPVWLSTAHILANQGGWAHFVQRHSSFPDGHCRREHSYY